VTDPSNGEPSVVESGRVSFGEGGSEELEADGKKTLEVIWRFWY
jgi:hypothetical protein